jgi:tetratricopeptide (TPR) repeat protein
MYVYRTSGFNNKAELYGLQDRINDLCVELETQRIDEVQARFERVYPYLKRRILNRRLIARILRVDDEQLLGLLDIFKRGDNDYEQFLEDPREYGRTYLEPQLNQQQIRDWLTREKTKQHPVQKLPELLSELRPWLEPPGWEMETLTEDWLIYESEEWVTQFRQREIQDAWETYYQIVSGIRGGTHPCEGFPSLSNVKLCTLNNHYVLYSEMQTADTFVGGVLFLLAAFNHKPSREEIIQVGQKTALFDGGTTNVLARPLSLHELTPFAQRSYPSYLLADEESWLAIERGKEANLALSVEEEQILQSVSSAAPGQRSLPLFINGRAGSGKSTMLLYLFADYCYRKYYDKQGHRRAEPLPGEPLFITYNERLLEVARDGVNTLLASHYRFVAERSQGEERENIDRFFQPFQKFLFGLLPSHERSHFDPEKYISFHRFKQLYQGKSPCESLAKVVLHLPQGRRYSPETSWHVIRSFIKGYGLEEYMTPEDYQQEVPRKEHTVSVEKFQGIYDTIWERWYKRITIEQGYWDDQDLIARVLKLKCYRPEYTAIFCDEAQDFTRLELQLIMRLSMFSQYHLGYQPLQSLPFAFAGDPFQTLNPTGFHWSSVQAIFDAEVITALDPADQLKLVINFQELANNYRSTPPIVQLTNLIQLWRHVLFDIPELKPQTAWQQGNFPEPQKFILNRNISPEELADYIRDTIIIVPCEEGEEAAYAQGDEVLSEIFPQVDRGGEGDTLTQVEVPIPNSQLSIPKSQEPLKNVLSAIAAKGLEFKKVILYKFGEDCNQNVWNLRGKGIDQRVKVEYFFNKLYVAASRATEHLFVVDSEKGDRQLWQYASDEALLQVMLRYARSKDPWEENVRTINTGTPRTMQQLREDDPGAIAYEFETKGLNSKNPNLLRRARQFYNDLGNTDKANFCEAWTLKFEENFLEAGNRFLSLNKTKEAWDCYWQGMCWSELVAWYNLHPENQAVERSIALFMVADPKDLEAITNFTSLISGNQELNVENWLEKGGSFSEDAAKVETWNQSSNLQPSNLQPSTLHSKQWKKAIAEYVNRIQGLLNDLEVHTTQWHKFGELLQALGTHGGDLVSEYNDQLNRRAAECFYRAENYEEAVRIWEECDITQNPEYNRAKARLLGVPEGLEYLAQAGEHDSIIAEWEKAGKPRILHWLPYVAPALEIKQQYQQAFVVYIWMDELGKVKECFEKASQGVPKIKLLTVLLQYLYRKKHWSDAIEAIDNYLPKVIGSERQKADLKFDFVYEIAGSELTPNEITKEHRKLYNKFLKEQVLSTSDWQQSLLMQQVGVALEKIGSLVETLEFYEQFVSHPNSEFRQFAQQRWIATKKKQEEYARTHGQMDKAAKSHSELVKKADSWAIYPDSVPLDPPAAPKERPTPQVSQSAATPAERSHSPTATKFVIQGLPSGTKVEQLGDGVIRFAVRHLVIKVMRQGKQVLITDALNSREVRVDGTQCKVNIGDATVEAVGGNQLSFALSTSSYRGGLVCDAKKPRLELDVQGLPNKISMEL